MKIFCQIIDPLPPIDHSTIDYAPFEKNFYVEHEDIRNLSNQQVNELRNKLGVNVNEHSFNVKTYLYRYVYDRFAVLISLVLQ